MNSRNVLSALVAGLALSAGSALAQVSEAPAEAPTMAPTCVSAATAAQAANLTSLVTAVQYVATLPEAEALVAVVTAEDPVEPPYTIFAPTNQAFDAAGVGAGATLPPTDAVLNILSAHVVEGAVSAEELAAAVAEAGDEGYAVTTLGGDVLIFTQDGDNFMVAVDGSDAEPAMIVATDVATCSGLVHVIDQVLVPELDAAAPVEAPADAPMMVEVEEDDMDLTTEAPEQGSAGAVVQGEPTAEPVSGAAGLVSSLAAAAVGAVALFAVI